MPISHYAIIYLFLLRKDQLKGCDFKEAAEVQAALKMVLLEIICDGFQKCWQKYVAAKEWYEVSSKNTETESVNTRILYLQGQKINPLQHIHNYFTIHVEASLKLNFWDHQQLLHYTVLNCLYINKSFTYLGFFRFKKHKTTQGALSGE
jgi:hypothetical protein